MSCLVLPLGEGGRGNTFHHHDSEEGVSAAAQDKILDGEA